MHFLIERIRYLRAWLAWYRATQRRAAGLEALFTEERPRRTPPVLMFPDGAFLPPASIIPLHPVKVGRQAGWVAAINDTVAWLEANGWYGTPRGRLQQYAAFLLERREAYERQGAPS